MSILETRKSGTAIPIEQLRLLTPMQKSDQYFTDDESDEGSDIDKEFPPTLHMSSSEAGATNVKEVCSDGINASSLDVDRYWLIDTCCI